MPSMGRYAAPCRGRSKDDSGLTLQVRRKRHGRNFCETRQALTVAPGEAKDQYEKIPGGTSMGRYVFRLTATAEGHKSN